MSHASLSLLPGAPAAGAARPVRGEYALDLATSRVGGVPMPVDRMWDIDRAPTGVLAWLAWALSVDEWDPAWDDSRKRAVLKQSAFIHRHKGTPESIRRALEPPDGGGAPIRYDGAQVWDGARCYDAGGWRRRLQSVEVQERLSGWTYDGSLPFDGRPQFDAGAEWSWAFYGLLLELGELSDAGWTPLPNWDDLQVLLAMVQPVRCRLRRVGYVANQREPMGPVDLLEEARIGFPQHDDGCVYDGSVRHDTGLLNPRHWYGGADTFAGNWKYGATPVEDVA